MATHHVASIIGEFQVPPIWSPKSACFCADQIILGLFVLSVVPPHRQEDKYLSRINALAYSDEPSIVKKLYNVGSGINTKLSYQCTNM